MSYLLTAGETNKPAEEILFSSIYLLMDSQQQKWREIEEHTLKSSTSYQPKPTNSTRLSSNSCEHTLSIFSKLSTLCGTTVSSRF